MKALIYKDLIAVWRYCRRYSYMCSAFLVLSVMVEEYTVLQIYPLILIGSLVSTLVAYDERDKWDRQVLTMPITRKQYVSAKYLTGLLLQAGVLVLTAIAHGLQLKMTGLFEWDLFWADAGLMLALCAAAPSMMLPFVFKNGSEKGRMAYLVVIGGLLALAAVCTVVMKRMDSINSLVELPVSAVTAAIALLLYPASWLLSIRWYEKREF